MSYCLKHDYLKKLICSLLKIDITEEDNIRTLVILSIRKSVPANAKKDNRFLLKEIEKYDCHQTSLIAKKKTKLIIDIENQLGVKISDDQAVKAQTVHDLQVSFSNAIKEDNKRTSNFIKNDFPFFSESDVTYLDSAATTQKPEIVIDAISRFYRTSCANTNRSSYPLAVKASETLERCRANIASYINAKSESISFTKGSTEAVNIVASALEELSGLGNKNIVISEIEHSSNRLPWENLCRKTGCQLRIAEITANGTLPVEQFRQLTDKNTVIVSVTGMSNINGFKPDLKQISSIAAENGALFFVDASQLIAHSVVDVQDTGCDFLCFSGHKIYAPEGTGVLYHSTKGTESLQPLLYGGGMLENKSELYLEAGTQNLAGIYGLDKALQYIKKEYFEREEILADIIIKKLRSLPSFKVFASDCSPIISFASDRYSTDVIAQHLFNDSIAVRTGSNCASWMLKKLGHPSVCRVSLGIYTDESDVQAFIQSIESI